MRDEAFAESFCLSTDATGISIQPTPEERMLEQFGAREMWLDTDYGWVVNGIEVQQHLARDPNWDLRTPRP